MTGSILLLAHFWLVNLIVSQELFLDYISPVNNAKYVKTNTQIVFKTSMKGPISIELNGSKSGQVHSSVEQIKSNTYLCSPDKEFLFDEIIEINIRSGSSHFLSTFRTNSGSLKPSIDELTNFSIEKRNAVISDTAITLPADFPSLEVAVNQTSTTGYIFISNISAKPYLLILNNDGSPYFFRKMPKLIYDFKKVVFGESDHLSYFMEGNNKFYLLNNRYALVDSFSVVNGYTTDFHDFQINIYDEILVGSYDLQVVDLTEYGGGPQETIIGYIIQQLNRSHQLLFQWRSWDHFPPNLQVHGNSFEYDTDGNIIVSFRGVSEIAKIDIETGEFIWRLGGLDNEFQFINDSRGFSFQHDARILSNGNITLLDNGNLHSPQYTRALEYKLDFSNHSVQQVWEFRNTPDTYSPFMGNVQHLNNGNMLIGYGGAHPTLVEVKNNGEKVFELNFTEIINSYRAFRYEWSGKSDRPFLWNVRVTESPYLTKLNFAKFGDNNIAAYNIYVNNSLLTTTTKPFFFLNSLQQNATYNIFVKSVNNQDQESLASNTISVITPIDTIAPATPSLSTYYNSNNGGYIRWEQGPDSDIKSYLIFADTVQNSDNLIETIDANESEWFVSGLSNNKTYFLYMRAVDFNNNMSTASSSVQLNPRNVELHFSLYRLPLLSQSFLVLRTSETIDSMIVRLQDDPLTAIDFASSADRTNYIKFSHQTSGKYSFIADVFFQDNTLLTDSIDYQVTLVKESYTHEVSEKISIKLNDKTSENTSIISSYSKKTGSFELSSNQKNDLNFDLKYTLTGESSEDINQQFEVYSSGEWKQITTYHNSLSNQLEASYNQFGKYRLTTHADSFENRRADTFSTVQNYPNPFNPTTTIHFYLSSETQVSLKIYNNLGQIIRTLINEQLMPASQYNFEWDGKNQHGKTVSSGIYFYQLKSGKSVITKKMLLIK